MKINNFYPCLWYDGKAKAAQVEIDYYWEKLGENGKYGRCGWLTDKFGMSWQIVPTILGKLMSNPEKSQNVVTAFMQMSKFDIEVLQNA